MSCLFAQSVQAGHDALAHMGLGQLLLIWLPFMHLRSLTGYGTASLAKQSENKFLDHLYSDVLRATDLHCFCESHLGPSPTGCCT
jgi:hypothetical protein